MLWVFFLLKSNLLNIGNKKEWLFPLPVCDLATIFLPFKTGENTLSWIFVGLENPKSTIALFTNSLNL